MDRHELHLKSVRFYERLKRAVAGGQANEVCSPKLLTSFERLACKIIKRGDMHRFTCYPWYGRVTHSELLAKANQLRVVTATRATAATCRVDKSPVTLDPLVSFFATTSAASIAFMTAAHFAVVARQLWG
jgi:hypothetical protein